MANSPPSAEQALLRIGEFTLSEYFNSAGERHIWIRHSGGPREGEGGAFSEADLEAVIRRFYLERF